VESSTVHHSERGKARSGPLSIGPAERARPRHRGVVMAKMMVVGDLFSALLAAVAALLILGNSLADGRIYIVAVALLWPLVAFSVGLYRADQLSTWASAVPEIPRGIVSILITTWPIFGIAAAVGIKPAIASVAVTVGAMAVFAGISRTAIRTTLHRNIDLRQRTLILGSGVVAGQVVEKIRINNQYGLDPVGIVDEEIHQVGTPDLPRLGGFDDLAEIIEMQSIDRVIIAFSRVSHEQLLSAIRACRDAEIAVDVVPRLFEFLDGIRSLDQIGGLPLLSIGVPVLSGTMVAAKRVLDVVGSAALLAIFSPLLIGTAIAIKLESKGPVFFRQPRAGRANKSFNLIKFRSMYVDAEERKAELDAMNESDDGVMFKIREDPRITRVGRIIRRFSIDELPQLFNVFKGEMSLVGPRPLIFREAAALEERWHLRRLELRPGITGPWQVYGRSQSPFQEMVRFDYQYVAGWSLARDFELLLATIPAVASGRGAY
jgi:exopolysaccharide biosynthesis polyprenyl glycosylphosphotransferase